MFVSEINQYLQTGLFLPKPIYCLECYNSIVQHIFDHVSKDFLVAIYHI